MYIINLFPTAMCPTAGSMYKIYIYRDQIPYILVE